MPPTPNRPLSQNKYSEQNMQNTSFDEDFGVNTVEALVYNPSTGNLDRMTQPATEDTLLLRKIVKLLESNAVVDIQNKQKITLDTITNGVSTGSNVALLGGGNGPSIGAPVNVATVFQPVWTGPVDQRFQIIDAARLTYDNGIRSHLTFT